MKQMKLERRIKNFIRRSCYSIFHFLHPDKSKIPPSKFYESFCDYSQTSESNITKEIYPSFSFNRNLPKSIYKSPDEEFIQIRNFDVSSDNVYKFQNCRVYGEDGIVITPDNKLIKENFIDGNYNLAELTIKQRYTLPQATNIEGDVALIASKWANCYYHWIYEILPKFNLIEKSGFNFDYFIINKPELPFQKASLEFLGVDYSKLLFINDEILYKTDNLIIPSLPGYVGNPPKWVFDYIKSKFSPNATEGYSEKIYISRKNTKFRRIVNEKEVLEVLETKGFRTVLLEELSLQEQINTFSAAKVIVAPHGAGLTNLTYASDNIQLLELFSPDYVNVCYWAVSNEKNIDYYYLKSKQTLANYDLFIDIDELLETMRLMEKKG